MNRTDTFIDDILGPIHIRVNVRARHLILRVTSDGTVNMTVPPGTDEHSIRQMLEQYRERIQIRKEAAVRRLIDEHFVLHAPLFRLSLKESPFPRFRMHADGAIWELHYPQGTVFHTPERQTWLRKVITEALRKRAKEVLPSRITRLSEACGLPFHSMKVNTGRGRWGSCSTRKDINLSCFLLLLPEHLIDYVILHELCHTLEMNHSPRFWAHLDHYTGHRSEALRRELRAYRTDF